jgi:arylsulfate sulfotransferase
MVKSILSSLFILWLSACGSGSNQSAPLPSIASNAPTQGATMASASNIRFQSNSGGVTPFISFVTLTGSNWLSAVSVAYTIASKPGAASLPVNVSFSLETLYLRGYYSWGSNELTVPVFGLYAGYANNLSLAVMFADASVQTIPVVLTTAAYSDPNGIYDHPVINVHRAQGRALGFNFFALKSLLGTPVVIDTDGEIRWVGAGIASSESSILANNGFEIGDPIGSVVHRLELDGSLTTTPLFSTYTGFNHNLDLGRDGYLSEVATPANTGSTVSEFVDPRSSLPGFVREWDFAQILTDYMISQGDDATAFVRPSADWFHANSATFDATDNSLIVSSRENFLMKVDYDTGSIIWIFGDPTKYWYTFPSLRAKAITLSGGGLYPIGQHATSIRSDGLLMIMNDGYGSVNQPEGAPPGETRTYSAVSAYAIDLATRSAIEVFDFDYGQSIFSPICGSPYQSPDGSLLVDFATASNFNYARLVGLDPNKNVVFDFQYSTTECNSSWNAVPIYLDNMRF